MRNSAFFIFILLSGVFHFSAFPGSIMGKLSNIETSEPVAAASILVFNTSYGTFSDDQGVFIIDDLPEGPHILHISSVGFITQEIEVEIGDEPVDLGIIEMIPGINQLNREIVISARRIPQIQYDSPHSISVLNQEELVTLSPRSSAEALFGMPGVFLQKTNHGGGSPIVRGLTGNQSLQMIDGIRLNNAISRYGPSQYFNTIDPNSISHIEVVRGAGSVQYGSDAIGGTIQVFTKSPGFTRGGFHAGGNLYGKFMSEGMEQSGRAELELGNERIAFYGGYSLRNYGDIVGGADIGKQDPSGYREMSADLKTLYRVGDNQLFTFAYQFLFQDDVDRWDQVAQRGYSVWKFDPQNRYLAYGRWDYYTKSKWFSHIQTTASLNRSEEQRISRPEGSLVTSTERDNISTFGITTEATSQPSSAYVINSGIEFYHDIVQSSSWDENSLTGTLTNGRGAYPSGANASSLALFSLHTLKLKRTNLSYGFRMHHYGVSAIDEEFGDIRNSSIALVGNLGMTFEFLPGLAAVASVNSGFRSPNIDDLTKFGRFDYGFEVPVSDLKPEKSVNAELGLKIFSDHVSGSLSFFWNNLFDLIDRVRSTYMGNILYRGDTVYRKSNVDQAYIQGVEIETGMNITPVFTAFGNMMYLFGSTSEGEPLRRIPPLNGSIGIRYKNPDGFSGRAEILFAGKQNRLSDGDISDHRIPAGGTPGWVIVNLYAGYVIKKLTFSGGLLNPTDETYKTHGSGIYGYGRCAQLSIRLAF